MYAAVGVLFTYIFVITFFIACFTLDQIRTAEYRNGLLPCIKHDINKKRECFHTSLIKDILSFLYSNFFFTKFGKVKENNIRLVGYETEIFIYY